VRRKNAVEMKRREIRNLSQFLEISRPIEVLVDICQNLVQSAFVFRAMFNAGTHVVLV
jgi:hypothetical protein